MVEDLKKNKKEQAAAARDGQNKINQQKSAAAPSLVDLGQSSDNPEIVIYTMPKRFLGSVVEKSHKAKSVGLLIIVFGGIVLIVAFGFIYFYFTKMNNKSADTGVTMPPKAVKVSTSTSGVDKIARGGEEIEQNNKIKSKSSGEKEGEEESSVKKRVIIATTTASTATTAASDSASTTSEKGPPAVFKPAPDEDNDSLSDLEEEILGTNRKLPDTDGDGYKDGEELSNLYNPAGSGKLIVNLNIKKYVNNIYRYSLYYPAVWPTEVLGGLESVMFKIGNGQFVQIITEENSEKKSVEEWYKQETGEKFIKSGQKVYKAGWEGVRSEDGLTVYLKNPASDYIFVLTYNVGLDTVLSYEHIFKMMVDSFAL